MSESFDRFFFWSLHFISIVGGLGERLGGWGAGRLGCWGAGRLGCWQAGVLAGWGGCVAEGRGTGGWGVGGLVGLRAGLGWASVLLVSC